MHLDGKALHLFLVVLEERLGTSQSTVSHILDKLWTITGEPLFVRAGRGITPASVALELEQKVRSSLDSLRQLTTTDTFDPATANQHFSIVANDVQRDFILPALFKRIRSQAPGVTFSVAPSSATNLDILREDHCQLMITPYPPDAADLIQRRQLTDHYACYYDPSCREAPSTLEAYLCAQHVAVVLPGHKRLLEDHTLSKQGLKRNILLTLPNFAGIAEFIRGTDLLATLPSLLAGKRLEQLASQPLPFDSPELDMYMLWHKRYQTSPSHNWLRQALIQSCAAMPH